MSNVLLLHTYVNVYVVLLGICIVLFFMTADERCILIKRHISIRKYVHRSVSNIQQ